MLELVEVAARHRGQLALGNPGEELAAVEELPPIDERGELAPVTREALRRTVGRDLAVALAVGVRRDQGGPGSACSDERRLDPLVHRDEVAQADRDGVRRA